MQKCWIMKYSFWVSRDSMKFQISLELQSISCLVEISGIEPLTSCLQGRRSPSWAKPPYFKLKWWAKMDSNHRPHDYQSCALASWAIGPFRSLRSNAKCKNAELWNILFESQETQWNIFFKVLQSISFGGEYRDRTGDLLLARQALSQLS